MRTCWCCRWASAGAAARGVALLVGDLIGLDTPIGRYLPRLVPGERGDAITVRMLINHSSGLAEYLPYAYPSLRAFPALADTGPQSLDDNRLTRFHPTELIEMGVTAPAVGAPGGTPGVYSNTNYLLLGELLEQVTGTTAERYITRNVIERAGLRDTELPADPYVDGPHSQIYEAWFGMIDPPRDYSVYDIGGRRSAGAGAGAEAGALRPPLSPPARPAPLTPASLRPAVLCRTKITAGGPVLARDPARGTVGAITTTA
ncbi:serine hydrolase domain-containing protein [Streptomyces avermitilis]|uniref:serine hydrolase domain-containing protein n=1 Tax=Streptomyces avermitilis TaxID=33903 RepID=UPI0031E75892